MNKAYIVGALRTPIGKTAGSLASLSEVTLLSTVFKDILTKVNINGDCLDDIIAGCCFPQEPYKLTKLAALSAGIPADKPATTVIRTCASSMEALVIACNKIMVENAEVILVGGCENMSQSPYSMKNAIHTLRNSQKNFSSFKNINFLENVGLAMESLARLYKIDKQRQNEYSQESCIKAQYAQGKGWFSREIVPVYLEQQNFYFDIDENIQQFADIIADKREEPLYCLDGTISKKNTPSINDGACAILVMSEKACRRYNCTPIAAFETSSLIGVDPKKIGLAPYLAFKKLIYKAGLKQSDIDLIECNEAYAIQACVCMEIGKWNKAKVNIGGGSLALGHPLGCTGIRICTTLTHHLMRTSSRYGIATMCAGGGMGMSILFENLMI